MMRTLAQRIADIVVPSERNGQLPYLLSSTATSAYLLVALVLLLGPAYLRVTELASLTQPTGFTPAQMVALTNQARAQAGLGSLTVSPALESAATAKAANMFSEQYFAHSSPSGKTPWDFLKASNYKYLAAGENLAADFVQASDAQNALMGSPSHRANILNSSYTEIGVAVGQGILNGRESIIVVEYFGKPKSSTVASTAPAPKPAPVPKPAPKPIPSPKPTSTAPTATTTPRVTTTSAVGSIAITPSTTPATVLGSAIRQPLSALETVREQVSVVKNTVPEYVKVKLVALLLMFSLFLAVAFLVNRTGRIPAGVAVRLAALVILLGYTATVGAKDWHPSTITATSASVVEVVQ